MQFWWICLLRIIGNLLNRDVFVRGKKWTKLNQLGVWTDLKNDNFDFQIRGKITPQTKVSDVSTYQPMRRTLFWTPSRGYLRASSALPPEVGLSPAADPAVPFVACCTPVACHGQQTSCPSSSLGHRYLSVTSPTQTEADLPIFSKGTFVVIKSPITFLFWWQSEFQYFECTHSLVFFWLSI